MRLPESAPGSSAPPSADSGAAHAGPAGAERFDPRQYLQVVLAHRWAVLLVLLAGTAAGTAYCVLAVPIYRATCRFEVFQEARLNIGESLSPMARLTQSLGRHVVIMQSRSLRTSIINKLRPKWEGVVPRKYLSPKLEIAPVAQSGGTMLDISVDSSSGEYCLEYLKELLQGYQEKRRSEMLEADENALRNLRFEQERLAGELEEAEQALVRFQQEHNLQFSQTKEIMDEQFLTGLVQRQNALRMERTMLETQFPFLKDADAATIQDVLALTLETHDTAVRGPSLRTLPTADGSAAAASGVVVTPGDRSSPGAHTMEAYRDWQEHQALVMRLKAEYTEKLRALKPAHPAMLELQQQIRAAEQELKFQSEIALKRLTSRYEALKMQEQALDAAAKSWRGDLMLSTAERATYQGLQAKVQHLRGLHDQAYTRILDGAAREVDLYYSRMVEEPQVWSKPVWPDRRKIMLMAVAVSLAAGIGLGFLLDYMDTSYVDVLSIEQRLGLRFLGAVPNWSRIVKGFSPGQTTIVVNREAGNRATEAYRSLRASLEPIVTKPGGFALLVTSAEAEEGKSFTCVNLAITFAWTGRRVLLVDGDVRRGHLHRQFGLKPQHGLTDLLLARVGDWHELVHPNVQENLSLLPAGKFSEQAPELLSLGGMERMLQAMRSEYDLVIIDAAPVARVVDSQLLSRLCEGVLIIGRHGMASLSSMRHVQRRLEGSRILGFCLNAVELPSTRYGYYGRYGKYGYYGRYGYYSRYGHYAYAYSYGYGYHDDEKTPVSTARKTPPALTPPAEPKPPATKE